MNGNPPPVLPTSKPKSEQKVVVRDEIRVEQEEEILYEIENTLRMLKKSLEDDSVSGYVLCVCIYMFFFFCFLSSSLQTVMKLSKI